MKTFLSHIDTKLLGLIISIFLFSSCTTTNYNGQHRALLSQRAQAMQAYERGDYDIAKNYYEELVAKIPKDADLWYRLGNTYARSHQPDRAISAYRNAIAQEPGLNKAWYNMGMIQLREVGNTFTQLLQRLNPEEPIYERSLYLTSELLEILNNRASEGD